MKLKYFSSRTFKEIIRDPINLFFGLIFPATLILLLEKIGKNAPVSMFKVEELIPGMTVFGLSFMTLFASLLISKDRESAFLQRLYTTPLKPIDFILGYSLPLVPMAVIQSFVCYLLGIFLGIDANINIIFALFAVVPISLLFIFLGLICGSIFNSRQVGGICGALLTNLTAWFSGIWFDVNLVGKGFSKISNLLPYTHAVELERLIYSGNFTNISQHIFWIILYMIISILLAITVFIRQMKKL